MRIVFAPDSFKNTISAADAAGALAEGWRTVDRGLDAVIVPMADGGEGTIATVEAAVAGTRRIPLVVDGPAGSPVETSWLMVPGSGDAPNGTAVIDLASTSGIELLSELRPLDADSTGLGQAVADALDRGVSRVLIGIGSSASTDGGTGVLRALGARFLDAAGGDVAAGARGLEHIVTVDLSGLRELSSVRVLSDVFNPLVGPSGAVAVFGPQKGLTDPDQRRRIDDSLRRLAKMLGLDPLAPGAGAAGGVGGALLASGACLVSGAAELGELIGLTTTIAGADAVVTGEGSYDCQSGEGKVPAFVAKLAAGHGVPAAVVAGRISEAADLGPFVASISLAELAESEEVAISQPVRWLRIAGAVLARRFGNRATLPG